MPSILLAISTVGLPDLRTSSAKARSACTGSARASIMKKIASACAMAVSVCARMRPARLSRAESSKPAVSITVNSRSPSLPSPSRRSRVTPGRLSTRATPRPTSRLNSVDLPTLGRPMMAIVSLMGRDPARAKADEALSLTCQVSAREGAGRGRRRPGRHGRVLVLVALRSLRLVLTRPGRQRLLGILILRRALHSNLRRRVRGRARLRLGLRFDLRLFLGSLLGRGGTARSRGRLVIRSCGGVSRHRRRRQHGFWRRLVALQVFRRNPPCDTRHTTPKQLFAFTWQLLFLVETENIELVHVEIFATGEHRHDRDKGSQ